MTPLPPRAGLLGEAEDFASIGRAVTGAPARACSRAWWIAFAGACGLLGVFAAALAWLLLEGVGVWHNNNPVVWALDIVAYDWWIGIACGALLTSATLRLTGAAWRSGIDRIAETTAILAAAAAALYPIIHLGRPWVFYWTLPYPNTLGLWPQFRSPLVWDAVDIVSFLGVCLGLWYVGLLPDLAALRDRAFEAALAEGRAADAGRGRRRRTTLLKAQVYGILALGWRGAATHWERWLVATRTLSVLALVLVVALQTGASVMLAGTVLPGWHDTLLPVTFLAASLLSGVGVTAALAVLVRRALGLEALITGRHIALMARLMLGLSLASAYCYATEIFSSLLHGDAFDRAVLVRRLAGSHAWAFWIIVVFALLPVQLFWFSRFRRSGLAVALVGIAAAIGSFGDHFMLLIVTLSHDFLPSSAHPYAMGAWGLATLAGSVGLFLALLLLGLRTLPMVSIAETRRFAERHPDGRPSGERAPTLAETAQAPLWGVSAEFDDAGDLAGAVRALKERDYGARIETYGPVPMARAADALGRPAGILPLLALGTALAGGTAFMLMCLYASGIDYVFDVGGRPRFSWQAFMVPSVSFGTLCGGLATVLALLFQNRLPRLNHPAFAIPGFTRASEDRFFLALEAAGPRFDPERIERALARLPQGRPLMVRRVPL
ncbi:polysulfide reductase [Methylobacterium variabile]|uniref:Polysulfide reductase n=1 Tax=Methylobacterium variabile TaxID=298794 RepID=A0A0J6T1K0_9HYPH|nr:quinol:electron acceptor oxidoreductase subunit ActD [Methylobacterium variabile]KMO39854.1 polysulfide reductase [Methylobacterium variabile]